MIRPYNTYYDIYIKSFQMYFIWQIFFTLQHSMDSSPMSALIDPPNILVVNNGG